MALERIKALVRGSLDIKRLEKMDLFTEKISTHNMVLL